MDEHLRSKQLFNANILCLWLATIAFTGLIYQYTQIGWLGAGILIISAAAQTILFPKPMLRSRAISWIVLIFPSFALLSTLWSYYPAITLRAALQLEVTVFSAIIFAIHLSPRQLALAVMVSEAIGAIGSIVSPGYAVVYPTYEIAWVGIFSSKNIQAMHLCLLVLSSIAVLRDENFGRATRLLALLGLLCGAYVGLQAKSLGAVVACVTAVAIMFGVSHFDRISMRMRLSLVLMFAGLIALPTLAIFVLGLDFTTFMAQVGKDPTLTGRTLLWDAAGSYIHENFWLGRGYYAFWVQETEGAEYLWKLLHVDGRSGFSFHNMFIHYAVDLGMIGSCIVGMNYIIILWRTARGIILYPDPQNAYLFAIAVFFVSRSLLEVDLNFPFTPATIIFYAITALSTSSRQRSRSKAMMATRRTFADISAAY